MPPYLAKESSREQVCRTAIFVVVAVLVFLVLWLCLASRVRRKEPRSMPHEYVFVIAIRLLFNRSIFLPDERDDAAHLHLPALFF